VQRNVRAGRWGEQAAEPLGTTPLSLAVNNVANKKEVKIGKEGYSRRGKKGCRFQKRRGKTGGDTLGAGRGASTSETYFHIGAIPATLEQGRLGGNVIEFGQR